jgi:hypothetical protein
MFVRIRKIHSIHKLKSNLQPIFKQVINYTIYMSRVSSGRIVSDYGMDDRAIGVRSPAGTKDFTFNLCVQTDSGAHPASCPMGTAGPFPGGKSAAGA